MASSQKKGRGGDGPKERRHAPSAESGAAVENLSHVAQAHGANGAQEDESGSAEQEERNDDAGGVYGEGGPPPEGPKDGVGPERPFEPGLREKGQAPGPKGQDEGAEPPGEEGDVIDEIRPQGISGFSAQGDPLSASLWRTQTMA